MPVPITSTFKMAALHLWACFPAFLSPLPPTHLRLPSWLTFAESLRGRDTAMALNGDHWSRVRWAHTHVQRWLSSAGWDLARRRLFIECNLAQPSRGGSSSSQLHSYGTPHLEPLWVNQKVDPSCILVVSPKAVIWYGKIRIWLGLLHLELNVTTLSLSLAPLLFLVTFERPHHL